MFATFRRAPALKCRIVKLAVVASILGFCATGATAAETGTLRLRCANTVNGTSWPVVVDTEHKLVDSLPATISDTSITWRNAKGGIFRLDRATGNLQLSAPSSTGGYFLHYLCQDE